MRMWGSENITKTTKEELPCQYGWQAKHSYSYMTPSASVSLQPLLAMTFKDSPLPLTSMFPLLIFPKSPVQLKGFWIEIREKNICNLPAKSTARTPSMRGDPKEDGARGSRFGSSGRSWMRGSSQACCLEASGRCGKTELSCAWRDWQTGILLLCVFRARMKALWVVSPVTEKWFVKERIKIIDDSSPHDEGTSAWAPLTSQKAQHSWAT